MKLDEKHGIKGLVVLFDLNGTLVSRNKGRAATVRPGVQELAKLKGSCHLGKLSDAAHWFACGHDHKHMGLAMW